MKTLNIYVFIIFTLFFFSCKDKSEIIYESSSKGKINGTEWSTSNVRAIFFDDDENLFGITITASDNGLDFLHQSFGDVPLVEGRYELNPSFSGKPVSVIMAPLDGDAIRGVYNFIESDSLNHFTILEYDNQTKEINGTFRASYVKDSISVNNLVDTVWITDGVFSTVIKH